MSKRTVDIEALNKSIIKWWLVGQGLKRDKGAWDCALCHIYYINDKCAGCPVAQLGYVACKGSPYSSYQRPMVMGDCEEATFHAHAEMLFLARLRDELVAEVANGLP